MLAHQQDMLELLVQVKRRCFSAIAFAISPTAADAQTRSAATNPR